MLHTPQEEEPKLLEAVARGDKIAFAKLFYTFHQELGEFVFKLTKSSILTEEIVQDTFMKIWLKREDLVHIRSFRAYLFTITRNHAFNTLREETKRSFVASDLPINSLAADDTTSSSDKEILYDIVEQAVARLPPQQKKVWQLSKEEGLSYNRIAEKLALSPQTVKRHVSLAMSSVVRYVKMHSSNYWLWTFALSIAESLK